MIGSSCLNHLVNEECPHCKEIINKTTDISEAQVVLKNIIKEQKVIK